MSGYTHRGHVYFAAVDQYVKIGYSSQAIGRRLTSLTKGPLVRPEDLDRTQKPVLIKVIPDCVMRDERRLHSLFAPYRVVGEWFRNDLAFCRQLERMRYVTYAQSLRDLRSARADLKAIRRAAA